MGCAPAKLRGSVQTRVGITLSGACQFFHLLCTMSSFLTLANNLSACAHVLPPPISLTSAPPPSTHPLVSQSYGQTIRVPIHASSSFFLPSSQISSQHSAPSLLLQPLLSLFPTPPLPPSSCPNPTPPLYPLANPPASLIPCPPPIQPPLLASGKRQRDWIFFFSFLVQDKILVIFFSLKECLVIENPPECC